MTVRKSNHPQQPAPETLTKKPPTKTIRPTNQETNAVEMPQLKRTCTST